MAEPIAAANKDDITRTGERRVCCDGPSFSKHPRVFLTMVDDSRGNPDHVVCPYCSHVYRYDAKLAKAAGGHH